MKAPYLDTLDPNDLTTLAGNFANTLVLVAVPADRSLAFDGFYRVQPVRICQ